MDKMYYREHKGTWRGVVLDTYDFSSDEMEFDSIPLSLESSQSRELWNTQINIGKLIWNYLEKTKDSTP